MAGEEKQQLPPAFGSPTAAYAELQKVPGWCAGVIRDAALLHQALTDVINEGDPQLRAAAVQERARVEEYGRDTIRLLQTADAVLGRGRKNAFRPPLLDYIGDRSVTVLHEPVHALRFIETITVRPINEVGRNSLISTEFLEQPP